LIWPKGYSERETGLVHEGKPQSSPDRLLQQWQTLMHLAEVLGLEAKANSNIDVASSELGEAAMATGRSLTIAAGRSSTIADLIQQRQTAR